MEKYLRPERFDGDPSSSQDLSPQWTHWKNTFENFLTSIATNEKTIPKEAKLQLLTNHLSSTTFVRIQDCTDYDTAINRLDALFLKPPNEIYSRHRLAKRAQQPGESIDQYLQALKLLSKECIFQKVTAEQNESDFVRDAFISGLSSSIVRQRLLENSTLTLDDAFKQARALEMARIHSDDYQQSSTSTFVNAVPINNQRTLIQELCYFCGNKRHARQNCSAAGTTCLKCGKRGHFAKVCKSAMTAPPQRSAFTSAIDEPNKHKENEESQKLLSCIVAATTDLDKAIIPIKINGLFEARALIDTGSTTSFIDSQLVCKYNIQKSPCYQNVSMATSNLKTKVDELCSVNIDLQGHSFQVNLLIMEKLCMDVIIGHDILMRHNTLEMYFGGSGAPLKLCALSEANVDPICLFPNLSPGYKPIAVKSRRYSDSDMQFIRTEVRKLLAEGIIEPSSSPWRAQVLVTTNENHKKRMRIDYS